MNYKTVDGEKIYGYRWVVLALCVLAVICVNGATLIFAGMAVPLLTPADAGGYGLTPQEFQILNSCSYLTGFLFCLVTGTWADRKGLKQVMVVGLAISLVGAVLRCFTNDFMGMFLTSVVFGFGLAALNANSAKMLRLWFPGNMVGVAMGVYLAGATVGCALAVPIAAGFTNVTPVFIGVAVLSAVTLVAWIFLYKKHPDNEVPVYEPVAKHLGVVMKSKNLWIACLVIGFLMAAGAVNNGNLVAWLSGAKGVDAQTAAWVSSMCNITCSIGGIAFPIIIAKTHGEKFWLAGLAFAVAIGVGIYYFTMDGMMTAYGVIAVSILVGGTLPLAKALPAQLPDIKQEHMGAAGGLHSTMQNALAFLIPSFVVGPLITGADGSMNFDMVQYCYMGGAVLVGLFALALPKLTTGGAAEGSEQAAEASHANVPAEATAGK
ncbi:MAG: MFS transporter [Coriobacteriaceae bacterium]|nr:MFS transporter [Coriobacteriaceae bacterium]